MDDVRYIDGHAYALERRPDGPYLRDLNPPRRKYILYCKDYETASKYAAERDWHLLSWSWFTDIYAGDEVTEYHKIDTPTRPFSIVTHRKEFGLSDDR